MTRRIAASRRGRAGFVVACVAVLIGLVAPLLAGTAGAAVLPGQASPPTTTVDQTASKDPNLVGLSDIAACVKASQHLLVLLLMDESGSLQKTDPKNQRILAAKSALGGLASLGSASGVVRPPDVEVQLATFSNDFHPLGDWQQLNLNDLSNVQAQIDQLATRNKGVDTDFPNAVKGANASLVKRSDAIASNLGTPPCKVVVLFTDGQYSVGVRTPQQGSSIGWEKTYAPGIRLDSQANANKVGALGYQALCNTGGIADKARSDGVSIIAVPLTTDPPAKRDPLLQALALGSAPSGKTRVTCGSTQGSLRGAYLPAGNVTDLLERFDQVAAQIGGGTVVAPTPDQQVCPTSACADGARTFNVDASVTRVHILAIAPAAGINLEITTPASKKPTVVAVGKSSAVVVPGAVGRAAALSSTVSAIDIPFTKAVPADVGTWRLTFVDPLARPGLKPAQAQVSLFSRLSLRRVKPDSVRQEAPNPLQAELSGAGPNADVVATADVVAVITDPGSGQPTTIPLSRLGRFFTGTYTPPAGIASSSISLQYQGSVTTTGGVTFALTSLPYSIDVLRPAAFPDVKPGRLTPEKLTGAGSTSAVLTFTATTADGCVAISQPRFVGLPSSVGKITTTFDPPAAGCVKVKKGRSVTVKVTFKPEHRADASIRGVLPLQLTSSADPRTLPVSVPITFDLARGVDERARLIATVLLLIAGIVLPLVGLVIMNVVTTRFQEARFVRGAHVPVLVSEDAVFRRDGPGGALSVLNLTPSDFEDLQAGNHRRRFTWAGLDFVAKPNLNPFGEGWTEIAPSGGAQDMTTREGTRVSLDLGLAGSWIFLLDQDATNRAAQRLIDEGLAPELVESAEREVYGVLVAFIALGPTTDQVLRLLPDIVEELPTTARRLEVLARTRRKPTRAERKVQRQEDREQRAKRKQRGERAAAAAKTRQRLAEEALAERLNREADLLARREAAVQAQAKAAEAEDATEGSGPAQGSEAAAAAPVPAPAPAPAPTEPAAPMEPPAAPPAGFTGLSGGPATPTSSEPAAPSSSPEPPDEPLPPPPVGFTG